MFLKIACKNDCVDIRVPSEGEKHTRQPHGRKYISDSDPQMTKNTKMHRKIAEKNPKLKLQPSSCAAARSHLCVPRLILYVVWNKFHK